MKTVQLKKFAGNDSTILTGRPEGKLVRKTLGLEQDLRDGEEYNFIIDNEITSFNPSFYLGLFFESIKELGWAQFDLLVKIQLMIENEKVRRNLEANIEDARRYARNEIKQKSGLKRFL